MKKPSGKKVCKNCKWWEATPNSSFMNGFCDNMQQSIADVGPDYTCEFWTEKVEIIPPTKKELKALSKYKWPIKVKAKGTEKKTFSSCCYEPIKTTSKDDGKFIYFCPSCGECVNSDGTNPDKPVYHSMSETRRINIMKEKPKECKHEKLQIVMSTLNEADYKNWKSGITCLECGKMLTKEETVKMMEERPVESRDEGKTLEEWITQKGTGMNAFEEIRELQFKVEKLKAKIEELKDKHNEFGHVFEASTRNMWTEIGLLKDKVEEQNGHLEELDKFTSLMGKQVQKLEAKIDKLTKKKK
jgi:hypothetical protein